MEPPHDPLGRELNEKRAEIIDGLCELGIKVTAARAMVAKIECTVTLPEGTEEEPELGTQRLEFKELPDEMPPLPPALDRRRA